MLPEEKLAQITRRGPSFFGLELAASYHDRYLRAREFAAEARRVVETVKPAELVRVRVEPLREGAGPIAQFVSEYLEQHLAAALADAVACADQITERFRVLAREDALAILADTPPQPAATAEATG